MCWKTVPRMLLTVRRKYRLRMTAARPMRASISSVALISVRERPFAGCCFSRSSLAIFFIGAKIISSSLAKTASLVHMSTLRRRARTFSRRDDRLVQCRIPIVVLQVGVSEGGKLRLDVAHLLQANVVLAGDLQNDALLKEEDETAAHGHHHRAHQVPLKVTEIGQPLHAQVVNGGGADVGRLVGQRLRIRGSRRVGEESVKDSAAELLSLLAVEDVRLEAPSFGLQLAEVDIDVLIEAVVSEEQIDGQNLVGVHLADVVVAELGPTVFVFVLLIFLLIPLFVFLLIAFCLFIG
ncbi:hypothetical protein TYRP_016830 [Tyrophagus putrescentiae]|nr:hypothetical protein TYRP_016830 [Tyrophagus putrescentiae]